MNGVSPSCETNRYFNAPRLGEIPVFKKSIYLIPSINNFVLSSVVTPTTVSPLLVKGVQLISGSPYAETEMHYVVDVNLPGGSVY